MFFFISSGKQVSYSEDTIDVHVVKFHGGRIMTPITRMRVGAEMPVIMYGTDEHQNPYSFGSAIPYLQVRRKYFEVYVVMS